ncbi:MAG TPA: LPS export ABC transporter periplasmic protein LptC, partial [Thermoanaerobaculia bacterium]|nr:LPS export ABC transporter periplasmic protein LptC [Thermoanaerobaculia bacterium]
MQTSIRILRIVLPLLFVAFLLLIGLSYTRSAGLNQTTAESERSDIRQEKPRVIAHEFEDTHSIGGRVISRIRARRTMGFDSGWYTLEDVEMTIFRKNGEAYQVAAPQAQFKADTKEAEAKGGVRITSSDGIEIATREIHFDGRRLVNRIPVRFRVDQWRGTAESVDLDVPEEKLELAQGVTATMTPAAPGEPPMTLRARSVLFDRTSGAADFRGEIRLTRQQDSLEADQMTARFDQNRRILVGLEGEGNVRFHIRSESAIRPAATGASGGGAKLIRSERFIAAIGGQGEIRGITLLGENEPVHATLDGPPRREITARKFVVDVNQEVVTAVRAETEAMVAEPETRREMQANRIQLYLDQNSGRLSSAYLEGGILIRDPQSEARADRATYDVGAGVVLLTAGKGGAPSIRTEGHLVKAEVIEIS